MIKVGDQIEILVNNAHHTSEKKGTRLVIKSINGDIFSTSSTSSNVDTWYFRLEYLQGNEIKHIPQPVLYTGYDPSPYIASGQDSTWNPYNPFYILPSSNSWENDITKTKTKCECGQSKLAQNKDDDRWDMHSTWCNIYKEGKSNENK